MATTRLVILLGTYLLIAIQQVPMLRLNRPAAALLGAVVLVSGLLSALFVNDTICLVLTPLLIAVLRPLRLPARPFPIALALSANVGSAMTPTGNPQNMLIAVATRRARRFAESRFTTPSSRRRRCSDSPT